MSELPIVDKAKALERLDNDEDLYQEVVAVFLEDTPVQLGNLKQALANNAVHEVTRLSHSLKSAAGNIGADRLSVASFDVERASKRDAVDELPALVTRIEAEFELLKTHLVKASR